MNAQILQEFYEKRGISNQETAKAIEAVLALESMLNLRGMSLEDAPLETIKVYVEELAEKGESEAAGMLALSRYFYLANRQQIYLYLASVVGGIGVIDSIRERMAEKAGKQKANEVFGGLSEPPLGTPGNKRPEYIRALMRRAEKSFCENSIAKIFAGNNHGIPESSMEGERAAYKSAVSLDEYLEQRHARKVAELQEFCDTGKVWFEQIITQDVVDYVASNQEILSAVREGSTLYVTKIPYDIVNFLKEKEAVMKRYYACHCPFVRESILSDGDKVSRNWCYCSGGFAKFPFEQVLERELEVKLLKSAIDGDDICRFAIDIGDDYK